ncbi:hypothetical protein SLA2020_245280 [Shorea laevis]
MVADSINVDEYLTEAGGREDVGDCESNSNWRKQSTSDPIENPESNGREVQAEFVIKELGHNYSSDGLQGAQIDKATDKEDWAERGTCSNMQMGLKVRPVEQEQNQLPRGLGQRQVQVEKNSDMGEWAIGDACSNT